MLQMKEQGKNPQEQINEEAIGPSIYLKKIQSSDSKDDPKYQK